MKTLITLVFVLFTLLSLTSCGNDPKVTVRILETNEKTLVSNPGGLYIAGDTIQVHYNFRADKWVIDELWLNFQGNKKVIQNTTTHSTIIYKAVIN